MHAIVIEGEADHDRIHAQHALEVADDRDRAALADRERLFAPLRGERRARLGERRILEGNFGCRRTGKTLELDLGVSGKTRAHESMEGGTNFLRVLCPYEPKRYLRHGLARNHGFRSFAGIAPDHAVD